MDNESDAPLAKELAYFEASRAELIDRYLGKFVAIRGDRLLGSFDTAEAAYEAAMAEFGLVPFLVRQVLENDPIEESPALFTGLVNAGG